MLDINDLLKEAFKSSPYNVDRIVDPAIDKLVKEANARFSQVDLEGYTELGYVYGLVDPNDSRVRYVGKTINPTLRFNQHLAQVDNPKAYWLYSLLLQKQRPSLTILSTVPIEKLDGEEIKFIEQYRKEYPDLTNIR